MNIIITGGNGFIGTNLAEKFSNNGHKVFLFDYKKEKSNKKIIAKKIKFQKVDITSLKSLKKIKIPTNSILLHCEVNLLQLYHFKNLTMIIKNILGMMNIINFAKKNKVKKIIFASTFNVYKENFKFSKLKEISECEPKSLYAISKLAAENYLRVYGNYLGLKWNIVRMFNIYGPGQR